LKCATTFTGAGRWGYGSSNGNANAVSMGPDKKGSWRNTRPRRVACEVPGTHGYAGWECVGTDRDSTRRVKGHCPDSKRSEDDAGNSPKIGQSIFWDLKNNKGGEK